MPSAGGLDCSWLSVGGLTLFGASRPRAVSTAWFDVLPAVPLVPDTPHRFRLAPAPAATHVRLDIFPDGGMARLRLHGRPDPGVLSSRFADVSRPV